MGGCGVDGVVGVVEKEGGRGVPVDGESGPSRCDLAITNRHVFDVSLISQYLLNVEWSRSSI